MGINKKKLNKKNMNAIKKAQQIIHSSSNDEGTILHLNSDLVELAYAFFAFYDLAHAYEENLKTSMAKCDSKLKMIKEVKMKFGNPVPAFIQDEPYCNCKE